MFALLLVLAMGLAVSQYFTGARERVGGSTGNSGGAPLGELWHE